MYLSGFVKLVKKMLKRTGCEEEASRLQGLLNEQQFANEAGQSLGLVTQLESRFAVSQT